MTENYEKVIAVLTKESLRDAFDACATEADAVKLLAEYGVETTESELKEALTKHLEHLQTEEGELSEGTLEQVAGGWSWGAFWKRLWHAIGSVGQGTGSNY